MTPTVDREWFFIGVSGIVVGCFTGVAWYHWPTLARDMITSGYAPGLAFAGAIMVTIGSLAGLSKQIVEWYENRGTDEDLSELTEWEELQE